MRYCAERHKRRIQRILKRHPFGPDWWPKAWQDVAQRRAEESLKALRNMGMEQRQLGLQAAADPFSIERLACQQNMAMRANLQEYHKRCRDMGSNMGIIGGILGGNWRT